MQQYQQPRQGIHVGAQQAMNAGVGGLHHPIPKQPQIGPASGLMPHPSVVRPIDQGFHPMHPGSQSPLFPAPRPMIGGVHAPLVPASRAPGAAVIAAMMAARGGH